jgi:hypothetical protein
MGCHLAHKNFVPAGWLVKRFCLFVFFLLIEKIPVEKRESYWYNRPLSRINLKNFHLIKRKPRSCGALGFSTLYSKLSRNHVGRTWAFFALTDLEFDLLAFIE